MESVEETEYVLLSEIGAIVQVIEFRQIQPESSHCHIFPVRCGLSVYIFPLITANQGRS